MSGMGFVFLAIAAVAGLCLAREGAGRSSWLEEGDVALYPEERGLAPAAAAKSGLIVFLAVVACLFSLLVAAFFMRMETPDWRAPPMPAILWANTGALVASSVLLQLAQFAATRDERERMRRLLFASGACAALFLSGQIAAWRELQLSGAYAASNAANAFFYLLTGMHGLHLLGGLAALARTSGRAVHAESGAATAASLELCAIYWHFLLLVWLLLFAMLAGGAEGLGVICRSLLG